MPPFDSYYLYKYAVQKESPGGRPPRVVRRCQLAFSLHRDVIQGEARGIVRSALNASYNIRYLK